MVLDLLAAPQRVGRPEVVRQEFVPCTLDGAPATCVHVENSAEQTWIAVGTPWSYLCGAPVGLGAVLLTACSPALVPNQR